MAFLKWEDYVIFAITLFLSLGIGLFYSLRGTKKRTTRQFILGDGNMWTLPVALSLMVSYESGIMMLGVPAEVYMYGVQYYVASIAGFISHLVTLHLLIPAQRELPITSMNQYFELRYNSRGLRLFATIISLLSSANYLGSVVFVPAITLEMDWIWIRSMIYKLAVLMFGGMFAILIKAETTSTIIEVFDLSIAVAGIPMWISIVTLTVVVLIYTIMGGFTAVIWTDVFQAVLMFVGMFAILIKGTIEAGGVKNTWTIIWEKGRINLLDFNPDPTIRQSFWSLFVGGLINGLKLQFSQPTFQRVKATPTLSTAKCMFLLASIMFLVISGLAVMEGAVMFAYYHVKGCDPLEDNQVSNQNQLIAVMVRDIFQDTPCLPGLFLAALFSASLSTMSSVLSAMSAMFLEDIVKPHTKPMSDKQAIRIAQLSVLGFGGLAIAIAFGISGIEGPVSRIFVITGACLSGTIGGLFILGWFVPIANSVGGLAGGVVSFVVVGWISFGKLVSKGVRVSPKLVPASTENCPVFNFSNATPYENTSAGALWNYSTYTTESAPTSLDSGPQGLDILYSLSYKWLTPVGICLVLIVGSLVSLLQERKPVHPSLVVPVCDYLCVCFPERIRRIFRCGVKYPEVNEGSAEDSGTAELTVKVCSAPEHTSLDQGNQNSVC